MISHDTFIELDDGKIYRKALYLMVKTWFPVNFPLKQPNEPTSVHNEKALSVLGANKGWDGTTFPGLSRWGVPRLVTVLEEIAVFCDIYARLKPDSVRIQDGWPFLPQKEVSI